MLLLQLLLLPLCNKKPEQQQQKQQEQQQQKQLEQQKQQQKQLGASGLKRAALLRFLAQIITAEPDIMTVALTPEDRFFVLACDGIWDVMSNQVCARACVCLCACS